MAADALASTTIIFGLSYLNNNFRSIQLKLSSEEKVTAKKLALAAFAFTLLGIFCVYKMEIDLTLKAAVLGIAWLFGLAMVVACMAALGQSFNQWMLRHGATDAQWFFFTSEPKGLVEMREQLRAEKA